MPPSSARPCGSESSSATENIVAPSSVIPPGRYPLRQRGIAGSSSCVGVPFRQVPFHSLTFGPSAPSRRSTTRTFISTAVSYTHLRAHETPEHLVCRLLLEK